jgi:hypothetical protein
MRYQAERVARYQTHTHTQAETEAESWRVLLGPHRDSDRDKDRGQECWEETGAEGVGRNLTWSSLRA